jgi:tRNA-2-methylthio-N6-dimethylallyladenosine synthase
VTKKLYIKTFGCQMNVYDSRRMADALAPMGFAPADAPDDADMVVLNTCHIREKAAEKVYSELGRLHQFKQERATRGKSTIIAVGGCVGQAEGGEIVRRAPYVDLVFGPQTYHRLPELVGRLERERGVVDIEFPEEPKFDRLPVPAAAGSSAFLSIQEGCDRFCTFCVVPYTRGAEFSRPAERVMAEARRLVETGAREITLLGQNVNAYHGATDDGGEIGPREIGLGALIRRLAEINGLERIRYTTSYPADMDDELIGAHGEVEKLMPFLHLPVQSGADPVLKRMNRRHTVDSYRRIIDKLRAARPDIALSSDFIVGFPGETDEDFEGTVALALEIGFVQAYSFKYSARPGTPAATMDGQIAENVKSARLAALQKVLGDNQTKFNRACVGRIMDVLLDRAGTKPGQLLGRSPYMQPVHVEAPHHLFGAVVPLRITGGHPNSLSGVPVAGTGSPPARPMPPWHGGGPPA